jgi:hypothetical protein
MGLIITLIALAIVTVFFGGFILQALLVLVPLVVHAVLVVFGSMVWLVLFCFRPRTTLAGLRDAAATQRPIRDVASSFKEPPRQSWKGWER